MLTRQRRRYQSRRTPKRPPQQSILRCVALAALRLANWLLWPLKQLPLWADILTVAAAAYLAFQIFYETIPSIEPDAAISPSWEELPLKAKNRSLFFDMQNVRVFCKIENVTFAEGGLAARVPWSDIQYQATKAASVIPTTETITFPCGISKSFKASIGPPGWASPTSPFGPADKMLPIGLIKLRIKIDYAVLPFVRWEREAISQSFTWRKVSGGYQWLEGDASDAVN